MKKSDYLGRKNGIQEDMNNCSGNSKPERTKLDGVAMVKYQ